MRQLEEVMSSNAAIAHSMTFRNLDPYQIEILCETIYAELERFLFERPGSKTKIPSVNVVEFKHIQISGMRKFYIDQIEAQKVRYNSFCDTQRHLTSGPGQITDRDKSEHIKKFKQSFKKLDEKKDPARRTRQVLKVSNVRRSA